MKKPFLIFLLFSSLTLPGCGPQENDPPEVIATYPANGTAGVMNGAGLSVIFNMAMNPIALSNGTNYSVIGISGIAAGQAWPYYNGKTPGAAVSFDFLPSDGDTTVTIDSTDGYLKNDSCFLLIVSDGIRSAANQTMEAPYQTCFCTAADATPCAGY